MMRTIHLHGLAADRFGPSFRLDVLDVGEAVRALGSQLDGFRRFVLEHDFRVLRGATLDRAEEIGPAGLRMRLGAADLHLVPIVAGSGGGKGADIGKIIGGTLLAAVAWWAAGPAAIAGASGGGMGAVAFGGLTYGNIAGLGLMVALSGVSGLLTPTPTSKKNQNSVLFSGITNTSEEGSTIPWVWGTCLVGGVVVSSGLSSERIPVGASSA